MHTHLYRLNKNYAFLTPSVDFLGPISTTDTNVIAPPCIRGRWIRIRWSTGDAKSKWPN